MTGDTTRQACDTDTAAIRSDLVTHTSRPRPDSGRSSSPRLTTCTACWRHAGSAQGQQNEAPAIAQRRPAARIASAETQPRTPSRGRVGVLKGQNTALYMGLYAWERRRAVSRVLWNFADGQHDGANVRERAERGKLPAAGTKNRVSDRHTDSLLDGRRVQPRSEPMKAMRHPHWRG